MNIEQMILLFQTSMKKESGITNGQLKTGLYKAASDKHKLASLVDAMLGWAERCGCEKEHVFSNIAFFAAVADDDYLKVGDAKRYVKHSFTGDFKVIADQATGPTFKALCEYAKTDRNGLSERVNAYTRESNRRRKKTE